MGSSRARSSGARLIRCTDHHVHKSSTHTQVITCTLLTCMLLTALTRPAAYMGTMTGLFFWPVKSCRTGTQRIRGVPHTEPVQTEPGPVRTYDVPGVDAQAAEQGLVAVRAPPLIPETHRLVDVLEPGPHGTAHEPAESEPTHQNHRHTDGIGQNLSGGRWPP